MKKVLAIVLSIIMVFGYGVLTVFAAAGDVAAPEVDVAAAPEEDAEVAEDAELDGEDVAVEGEIDSTGTSDPTFVLTQVNETVEIGDTVDVIVQLRNGAGLTSAQFYIQYNPYRLAFVSCEVADDISAEGNIMIQSDDDNPDGEVQYFKDGSIKCSVPFLLIHLNQFPESLANCDLAVLHFKAIGGGDCRLMLMHDLCEIADGDEANPQECGAEYEEVIVPVECEEGQEAEDWDYAWAPADVTVPDVDANTTTSVSKSKKPLIIAVIAIIVVAVVLILVIVLKNNGVKEDEPEKAAAPEKKVQPEKKIEPEKIDEQEATKDESSDKE